MCVMTARIIAYLMSHPLFNIWYNYFICNFIRACYVGNTITQERRGHSCDALIFVLVAQEISRTGHHPCLQYDFIDSAKLLKEIKMRGQLQWILFLVRVWNIFLLVKIIVSLRISATYVFADKGPWYSCHRINGIFNELLKNETIGFQASYVSGITLLFYFFYCITLHVW